MGFCLTRLREITKRVLNPIARIQELNMINMKKLISLSIGCSLALAGAALAQQPDEQQSQSKNKRVPEKTHATQAQPKPNTAKPEAPVANQRGAMKEPGAKNEQGALKERGATTQHSAMNESGAVKEHGANNEQGALKEPGAKNEQGALKERGATTQNRTMNGPGATKERGAKNEPPRTNVSGEQVAGQAPSEKQRIEQQRKGMKGQAGAQTSTNPTAPSAAGAAKPQSGPANGQQNMQANAGARAKKPDPQQVQQIKSQHANFRAQPKPQQVPTVTFNQNNRIQGSEHWQGAQYQVFRSYQPQWHDQAWYHSHYNRVELIGGGYYYLNNGYWYPAWGYNPSVQYYAYDGPIYAGQRAEPPDKVIADVQAELQQMGYYKGEVDGLLGPLTREALTAYQADQGLTQTAAIDEPTLDTLGMS
jgi:hypothetical protein